MTTILIVDDDRTLRRALAVAVIDLGHRAVEAAGGEEALAHLAGASGTGPAGGIDAVLLDLRMPGLDGMEVLRRIRAQPGAPPVAILTAVPTGANTIEAMRLGAADHLAKPIGRDELRRLLERLLPPPGAAPAVARTLPDAAAEGELVGGSAAMRDLHKTIGLLADSDATALLLGETGTGKELVARAIHTHGRRGKKPFVPVNCAAIPSELLESLLFGHVRGAFTGAAADRPGSFREASGGTLFLDEIGDMDPLMQAKLLRALQERVVTPVGGRPVAIDVRVIAATHRDLERAVREGRFRADLYYRLGVVPVLLPPLRGRLADIVPLAEHFLALAAGPGTAPRQLSAGAAARLLAHRWPGNVRELGNAMRRVATVGRRAVVEADDLLFLDGEGADPAAFEPASPELVEPGFASPGPASQGPALPVALTDAAPTASAARTLPEAVELLERAMIRDALAATGNNRAQAAERLGIRRQLLYGKMERYGLLLSASGTDAVPDADTLPPAEAPLA